MDDSDERRPLLRPGEVRVAPSILSADFGELAAALAAVAPATDWLHVDVMDGHFVPNLTLGPPVVASLRRHSAAFFDCHLMMTDPGEYLGAFRDAGADLTTVHLEIGGTAALIGEMRRLGLRVGLALNPDTSLELALPFIDDLDLLLLMTVFPGFAGQTFITSVVPKIEAAHRAVAARGAHCCIEVDGGIAEETAALTAAAGARVFVAGSAVFNRADPAAATRAIAAAAGAAVREA